MALTVPVAEVLRTSTCCETGREAALLYVFVCMSVHVAISKRKWKAMWTCCP